MVDIEKLDQNAEECVKQLSFRMSIFMGAAFLLALLLVGDGGTLCVIFAVVAGVVCVFARISILSTKITATRISLTEEIRKSKE